MSGKNIMLSDKKISKGIFCRNKKKIFNIDDRDPDKMLVSKREYEVKQSSFTYFIEYYYNYDIRPHV